MYVMIYIILSFQLLDIMKYRYAFQFFHVFYIYSFCLNKKCAIAEFGFQSVLLQKFQFIRP